MKASRRQVNWSLRWTSAKIRIIWGILRWLICSCGKY